MRELISDKWRKVTKFRHGFWFAVVMIVFVYLVNGFRDQTEEIPESIRVLEVSAGVAFLHK